MDPLDNDLSDILRIKDPPTFKTEHSLFLMFRDGSRKFDMRRFDRQDARIVRLSATHVQKSGGKKDPSIVGVTYDEAAVKFVDKDTSEVITFAYQGMVLEDWAPEWCFLLLGAPMLDGQTRLG